MTPTARENESETKGGPASPVLYLLGFAPEFWGDENYAVVQVQGHKTNSYSNPVIMLADLDNEAELYASEFDTEKQGRWSYAKCIEYLRGRGWLLEALPRGNFREALF